MQKTSSRRYRKSIYLDKSRMDEMYAIITSYCDRISIRGKVLDNATIKFDTYEELINYENFNNGRIVALNIDGYRGNSWSPTISVEFSTEYGVLYSVDYSCSFSSQEDETIFLDRFSTFLEKSKSITYYNLPYNIIGSIFLALIIIFVARVVYLNTENFYSISIAISVASSVAISVLSYVFAYKLFPPVYFAWGEAVKYYDRLNVIRKTIFGSIIGAGTLGIAINWISKYLVT